MKRIKKVGTVEELIGRARKLSPDARPRWGRLSARQMLCHVTYPFYSNQLSIS
jgi:hypothetical protein